MEKKALSVSEMTYSTLEYRTLGRTHQRARPLWYGCATPQVVFSRSFPLLFHADPVDHADAIWLLYVNKVLCACWAVEALTRAGQHDVDLLSRARMMFEDLMGYSNHVGLFSEEIAKDGSALGNMP